MAHRPFTPRQRRQNAAFLAALRRTGNVRLTCRELGVNRSTWTKRRAKCAAFATEWDATLAAAHAAFQLAGGERMPQAGKGAAEKIRPGTGRGTARRVVEGPDAQRSEDVGDTDNLRTKGPVLSEPEGLRTKGGEPTIVRLANGRLQLRLAPPGRMTDAARQLFLATVEETNNIRMAAAAAGGSAHTTLLARARRSPDFAGALRIQRRIGQDRALWSLIDPARADPDKWEIADLPMPKMTVEQAMLQLVYHHPDGAFQRSRWHRRLPPRSLDYYAPRIRARIAAFQRAEWHWGTGRWRYDDEDEVAGE